NLLRLPVPVEARPLHPRAAAVVRQSDAMAQERRTDAATAIFGEHENVFEVERGRGAKRRIGLKENRVTDRHGRVLPKRQPGLEARPLAEAILQQSLPFPGVRRRQFLKLRQRGDQLDQRRSVLAPGAAQYKARLCVGRHSFQWSNREPQKRNRQLPRPWAEGESSAVSGAYQRRIQSLLQSGGNVSSRDFIIQTIVWLYAVGMFNRFPASTTAPMSASFISSKFRSRLLCKVLPACARRRRPAS